ncbi:MAG: 3-oxo-4,17-pregnadiene-20-carboxyl-CoA hydratase alpha subunit, partial [Cryptosporangiaceae bacterium]|nr:3-oxo-4,17-pregnadiene-20-carboxyl-CoA hydratase alpha subunit [Cryptosporangiaceae bacterium]
MNITEAAARIAEAGDCAPRRGRDPVNLPMIRNWLEALGDTSPRDEAGSLAPPAMVQVWTMHGLHPASTDGDPLSAMSAVLDEA